MRKKGRGGIDDAIFNLMKWITGSAEWSDRLDAVMEDHRAKAIEESGLDRDTIMEVLGSEHSVILFGCAMEDLASRVFENEPHNLVDDYLKRRGWRETRQGRRYLEGCAIPPCPCTRW